MTCKIKQFNQNFNFKNRKINLLTDELGGPPEKPSGPLGYKLSGPPDKPSSPLGCKIQQKVLFFLNNLYTYMQIPIYHKTKIKNKSLNN